MTTLDLAQAPARAAALVLERYRSVRAYTAKICGGLSAEDQMVQSCPEASPTKWHQAHTSWFFETFVLTPFLPGYVSFHPDFHWLFNSYYRLLGEEIPEKRLRASFCRPSLDLVLAYRAHVDRGIEELLSRLHATENATEHVTDEVLRRVVLGTHHEQQHAELALTDIKHAFFTNPLQPAYLETDAGDCLPSEELRWISFDGGLQQIGYALNAADPLDFCFDNEMPRHSVYLQPYSLAHRLVTCAEYLEFMQDGAYTRPELWLSEGWDAVEREGWNAPLYWQACAHDPLGWRVFTLAGWRGLSQVQHAPVSHVSFFEADAYARWRGCRLPTEAEWEYAASSAYADHRFGKTSAGTSLLSQLTGECWQWTASPYVGYPGYRPLPGALGEYNGKFMSSQVVLRGGSRITPPEHLRATYRNFFNAGTRWQFSGIRLARLSQEIA